MRSRIEHGIKGVLSEAHSHNCTRMAGALLSTAERIHSACRLSEAEQPGSDRAAHASVDALSATCADAAVGTLSTTALSASVAKAFLERAQLPAALPSSQLRQVITACNTECAEIANYTDTLDLAADAAALRMRLEQDSFVDWLGEGGVPAVGAGAEPLPARESVFSSLDTLADVSDDESSDGEGAAGSLGGLVLVADDPDDWDGDVVTDALSESGVLACLSARVTGMLQRVWRRKAAVATAGGRRRGDGVPAKRTDALVQELRCGAG